MQHQFATQARFATTSWTLLEALQEAEHPNRERALSLLSERYWPAIYASFRRLGNSPEAAADLTQGFFTEVVLGRRLFELADAERGRLRTLILAAVRNYAVTAHRRDRLPGRTGQLSLNDLGVEEDFLARDAAAAVEEAFDRRWALSLLDEAMQRCEASLRAEGLAGHWQVFDARNVRPTLGAVERPSLAELAERFAFKSDAHVASAMKVVRKRLDLMLREVAAETALGAKAQDEEYRRLVQVLTDGSI